jgi:hypothetical protein
MIRPRCASVRGTSSIALAHQHLVRLLSAQSFQQRIWFDSPFVSRQVEGIGPAFSVLLVQAGIDSLEKLEAMKPAAIDLV